MGLNFHFTPTHKISKFFSHGKNYTWDQKILKIFLKNSYDICNVSKVFQHRCKILVYQSMESSTDLK